MVFGIKLRATGIEGHNSLNAGESLHSILPITFSKVEREHSDMEPEGSLSIAVYSMICNVNESGLYARLVVCGTMRPIPSIFKVLPSHVEIMRAMKTARSEYSNLLAKNVLLEQRRQS